MDMDPGSEIANTTAVGKAREDVPLDWCQERGAAPSMLPNLKKSTLIVKLNRAKAAH